MERDEFDLVVVGGGIYGICAAWDATLRGLTVALIEQGDFAHATSASSFKMVHGGVRYLQHADVYRMRESIRERNALLRVAPHLVEPLPIVIPTYGHGLEGKELLGAGLLVYDAVAFDRNRGIPDPDRRIRRGRLMSRDECLSLFPALDSRGLTGAAVFSDAQMYNPPRLALAFLRSAADAGAVVANYVEATGLVRDGTRVRGVAARDVVSGGELTIRGRVVLNAAGPWAERVFSRGTGLRITPPATFSRDACFVVARQLVHERYALAVQGRTRDPDAILSRKGRHLFLVPWRGHTLVGVWHVVFPGAPEEATVGEGDLRQFLDEINGAYPPLRLALDDISFTSAGLVLFGENRPGAVDLSYGKRSRIVDHAVAHGLEGLITVIGVRWTTARGVGDAAVTLALDKLGRRAPPCRTRSTPVFGGRIERMASFVADAVATRPAAVDPFVMRSLARNYGTEYRRVLGYVDRNAEWGARLGDSHVLAAEVVHAVREEMALKLADVVFRRTDLGTGGSPGEAALRACGRLMAAELGWSPARAAQELDEVTGAFPQWRGSRSSSVAAEQPAARMAGGR
ncbi:MAG TPA: glycerol-3-phosphate dehydrogenase/oxidase [Gemmatimonadaceae bacterium]|nr:glycerol-3-phosphate dehydrogenase/oxidase [Gemmatimonadaceae bacterium]